MDNTKLIDRLIIELNNVKYGDEAKLNCLIEKSEMIVKKIFGESSDYISSLKNVNFYPLVYPVDEYYYYISWNNGIKRLMNLFLTMKEEHQIFFKEIENKEIENKNTIILNKKRMTAFSEKKETNKKLQVFISSTYSDLIEERQSAVEAILKSGNIPAGMELFKSGNVTQLKTIKDWIDESDIYLLILGGRYGSIEAKSRLSYTHLEYNYAVKKKKPYFSVVITEDALNKKVKEFGTNIIELENRDKYNRFRKQVLKNISSFYNDKKDIQIAILDTLRDFDKKYEFAGWVPGEFLQEYNRLKKENEDLKKQIIY
ncbi:protein of unknown function [Clostridium acidisoli DSM 12555]|uniref:DUF4062 domain-containing protein n=1 Tax=Clostridium acidisoli DSM 12555 TaxID=1121291 RepID=A0A1W1XM28_9CLOT|nr:DUF4062 domain-containing protein [Clostridium acidisoli]SMC24601.1 protein of unknown function [Clostridium acidisoli DSM 12555]